MKKKIDNLIVKFKEFYKTTYGMLITMSWALLLICLIIKLFGGNWFELWWENDNFINFCNYVETKTWLKMSIACLVYLISGYFIISVFINRKMNLKLMAIFYPIMIIKSVVGWYNTTIAFILDLIILLGLTTYFNKNIKRNLICYALLFLLQLVSILIRNVSIDFNLNSTIPSLLYQIDYYIMIVLWFLYNFRRKEITK